MKTKLTTALFTAVAFSFMLYSCQKEETIRLATPNKPTVPTTTTTVVVPDPSTGKPIDNPTTPTPTTPSNPNHPPLDPNISVANSATCFNCHKRIKDAGTGNWVIDLQAKPSGLNSNDAGLRTPGQVATTGL